MADPFMMEILSSPIKAQKPNSVSWPLGCNKRCLLVAFDNVTDYATNYLFVQQVLSMDTTVPGNSLAQPLWIGRVF